MDPHASSESLWVAGILEKRKKPKTDEAISDDIRREDELLQKLEEMHLKLESGSLSLERDIWDGEDAECSDINSIKVKEVKRTNENRELLTKPRRQKKSQSVANNADKARVLEVAVSSKEKRFSFKPTGGVQKKNKVGKVWTEEEMEKLEQIRNLALQRPEKKTKRRRKRGPRSEHVIKKEDASGLERNQINDDQQAKVVGVNIGYFPVERVYRGSASFRSAVIPALLEDIHGLLFKSSATIVHITAAWFEAFVSFRWHGVVSVRVRVSDIKQPSSKYGTNLMTSCGMVQSYSLVQETCSLQLPRKAAKSSCQTITELIEGRAICIGRPGSLEASQVTEQSKYEEINVRRKGLAAVHAELLKRVIEMKSKPRTEYFDQMNERREKMAAIHAEVKRLVYQKGLAMDGDDDDDDAFVPRKLFVFKIEYFRKVPQIVVLPCVAKDTDADLPSCSKEPVADHLVENAVLSKEKKRRSLGRRMMKFLGIC